MRISSGRRWRPRPTRPGALATSKSTGEIVIDWRVESLRRLAVFPVLPVCAFFVTAAHAAQWSRTYGSPRGEYYASSVAPTADGGYIVGGSSSSFFPGETDAWIFRLDGAGNLAWPRTYSV